MPTEPSIEFDGDALEELRALCARHRVRSAWSAQELLALPRLYRFACSELARLEEHGEDRARARELRALVAQAHGHLLRDEAAERAPWLQRSLQLLLVVSPRAIRAEWRLLACSLALFYGLAFASWLAVRGDLELSYSLLNPAMVDSELDQLAALAPGEAFRGNFSFGLGESPGTAGWILLHNISVGVLFFASALLPPLYLFLLGQNALMLGTYTAIAGHFAQAGSISSILWTHGVLEIQALVLVGTAGLVLVRAWVRPGAFTRAHALVREGERALELFAPVPPMLVCAGLIEGFVSPHAPLPVRLAVAALSGAGLVLWIARRPRSPGSAPAALVQQGGEQG